MSRQDHDKNMTYECNLVNDYLINLNFKYSEMEKKLYKCTTLWLSIRKVTCNQ